MNNDNVSVTKIQQGMDYLEDSFMKPLVLVGDNLIDEYKVMNNSLQSERINELIRDQQNKLDNLKNEFKTICEKTRASMDESSKVVQSNQSSIDSTLGNN